jgi:hypothetical protein
MDILRHLTSNAHSFDNFLETGNIIILGFFYHLNTDERHRHIDNEFKVYRCHFHPGVGTSASA